MGAIPSPTRAAGNDHALCGNQALSDDDVDGVLLGAALFVCAIGWVGDAGSLHHRHDRGYLTASQGKSMNLVESLPSNLEKLISATIPASELRVIKLKGAFKECLVCTPQRLVIAKKGFMTGNIFGANVFQIPLNTVTSVEVKFGVMSGYMEVSTGGLQSTAKNYWSQHASKSPAQAPNCIAISSRGDADKFRAACSEILSMIHAAKVA